MLPSLCVGVQLFSELDQNYLQMNASDNFYIDKNTFPKNVRFRFYCYYQYAGILTFSSPIAFCLTRVNTTYSRNCSHGYANEMLDTTLAYANWTFNVKKPFEQYSTELTKLTLDFPIEVSSGLQMHIMLQDAYLDPSLYLGVTKPYLIMPLVTNQSISSTPYWDAQCDEFTYNTRPQYYIWKMVSVCIGAFQYAILLVLLVMRRKHRLLESRFVLPIIGTTAYLLKNIVIIILNIIYYDNEWDVLIEDSVIILVMSLHLIQALRYYAIRIFYSKFYSKRDNLFMRILLSKMLLIIGIILVGVGGGIIVTLLLVMEDYSILPTVYTSVTVCCCAGYLGLLALGIFSNIVSNLKFLRKVKSPRRILKWLFLHDDHFRYNGEVIALSLIFIIALVYPTVAIACGEYLTLLVNDETRPISELYLKNGYGYAIYGIAKTLFVISLGFQYIYLIAITYARENQVRNFKEQKEEMDLFISKTLFNGTSCVDIFKKYLIGEFKLELLEIYFYLNDNPKYTLNDCIRDDPKFSMFLELYFSTEELENRNYEKIVELLLEIFARMKQTTVYEVEYVEQSIEEIELVFKTVK